MKTLLVLLALAAVSAAFAPRLKRLVNTDEGSVNTDEGLVNTDEQSIKVTNTTRICAESTPCGWQVFEGSPERIIDVVVNTYCICDSTSVCKASNKEDNENAHVLHCIPTFENEQLNAEVPETSS